MKRALVFLALAGCGPRLPEPVSMESAERLRGLEAAAEYARILGTLGDRRDIEAQLARARGFRMIFDLEAAERVAENPELRKRFAAIEPYIGDPRAVLAVSMEADVDVLTGPSPLERRPEALERLVEDVMAKVSRPELRTAEIDAGLHRIVLLEAAAGFEHRRLTLTPTEPRARLANLFRDLAAAYQGFAERPRIRAEIVERWKENAESYRNLAILVEGESLPALPDLGEWADHTLDRHLREGAQWADRATVESTSGGDIREVERSYRASIRHLVFAREMLATLTTERETALSILSVALRAWESAVSRD